MAKLNKRVIGYSMDGNGPAKDLDRSGHSNGVWEEHVEILAEYMDFVPIIYSNTSSPRENLKLIENGTARIGSPQVTGLQ